MQKTILGVGAHYDDCVFGIPGTLLQAVRKNHKVIILTLIGDYSNWPPVQDGRAEEMIERTTAISKDYGVEMRYLSFASMSLQHDERAKREAAEAIAEIQPDTAFMLWPADTHPDHVAGSAIAKTALRWAGRVLDRETKRPARIYQYDNGPRHTIGFEPDTYVDVSDDWKQAIEWLGRFRAYVVNRPFDPGVLSAPQKAKESLARYRGQACGVEYAEAFKSFEPYPQEIL